MRLLKTKIKTLNGLKAIVLNLKKADKKIVFTNGCFDLLHYGHIRYLESAKGKGDILIVAINSDSSIKRIKGGSRPIINEADRIGTIAALESVDYVVLFDEDTPLKTIEALKPDIIVKGADWKKEGIVGNKFVSGYGGKVIRVKLLKGRSTTNLINRIRTIRYI